MRQGNYGSRFGKMGFTFFLLGSLWMGCGEGIVISTSNGLTEGRLAMKAEFTDDVKGFLFQVLKSTANFDQIKPSDIVMEKYVPIEQEKLANGLLPGQRDFADAFFLVPPARYKVLVIPKTSQSETSKTCGPAKGSAEVFSGKTTELILTSKCQMPDNGGLDIIVATNHNPIITGVDYNPSKLIYPCEPLIITAQAEDVDQDSIQYDWSAKGPQGAKIELIKKGNQVEFMADKEGTYYITATACDSLPPPDQMCNSMELLVHVLPGPDVNQNGIPDLCEGVTPPPTSKGRVVTMLLTLSNPRITQSAGHYSDTNSNERARLIAQAIYWAKPKTLQADQQGQRKIRVLLIRDDNHQEEFKDDWRYISDLLARFSLFQVTTIEEPANGLTLSDLTAYSFDVVWLSNPGHDVEDRQTVETLTKLVFERGKGLILQGDDMSWHAYMEPLTRLHNVTNNGKIDDFSNGVQFCCDPNDCHANDIYFINDNRYPNSYEITFERTTHPVIQGLEGKQYLYGDDIDYSIAIQDTRARVLAWATLAGRCYPTCKRVPVIVAYDPN